MKALGILLALSVFCTAWPQETFIKEVIETPDDRQLAASGIIDTKSGLTIKLDEEALLLWMEKNGGSRDELDSLVRIVIALDEVAKTGTSAIQQYLADEGARNAAVLSVVQINELVKPVANVYLRLIDIIDEHKLSDLEGRIKIAIEAVPAGADYSIRLAGIAFQIVAEFARETKNKLFLAGIDATLLLRHLRDADSSVRREVQFMEPLNDQDKLAWNQLLKTRNQTGGDPDQLEKLLTRRTLEVAASFYDAMRVQIESAIDEVKSGLEQVRSDLRSLAEEQEEKYRSLNNRFIQFQTDVVTLPHDIQSLAEELRTASNREIHDPSTAIQDLVLATIGIVTKITTLTIDVKLLVTDIQAVIGASQLAFEMQLRDSSTRLNELWDGVEDAGSQLATSAKTMFVDAANATLGIFNLSAVMKEIGQTVRPWPPNGTVEYKNVAGRLGGLPQPLVSGDELLFEIRAAMPGAQEQTTLESKRIYAYKIGLRTDRVFYLALSERTDGSAWRFAPTYSDVFVRGTRSSLFANRLGAIGIGSAISLLDQNGDDAFELGIGVVVSLLDHRLLFGYGFNTTLNRGYTFIGWRFRLG